MFRQSLSKTWHSVLRALVLNNLLNYESHQYKPVNDNEEHL